MTDYKKEAERLASAVDALRLFVMGEALPTRQEASKHLETLVQHIQRGVVPEGYVAVPRFLAENHRNLTDVPRYQRILDDCLAAAAPDQFRDAAGMVAEPSAFLAGGARYKISNGTVRGLPRDLDGRWVALVAAEDDCHLAPAPAEVPMPEPVGTRFDGTKLLKEADVRTYGAACRAAGEAAGYARGMREMLDCRTCRNYTRRGCIQTAQCVDGDGYRRATPVRFWSAALRGEVKP